MPSLTALSLSIRYRGAELAIDADPIQVRITRADDGPPTLEVTVHGRHAKLRRGERRTFSLPGQSVGA
ncbi:hypothetical protein Psi02_54920 [Planotetraspora silvatica]|uniref:Glycoside hydrolase family 65 C-terminal domain-containing protein n=1 Tax=Planotetraspora silvatica TaxID=234614 RepID=A0A8J3XU38_9ACTN|nr:glycosyl hydrolase family 65 protein [Planotetraspora silvatica]GII49068.1 hypothetical protein Psi02_54920 [Planotetraspora silvatica]